MNNTRRSGFARSVCVALLMATGGPAAGAETTLMSADWASHVCDAWNAQPVLTEELVSSGWAANDNKRGYKIIQLYRTECTESPRVQLRISVDQELARCVYGGAVDKPLDLEVDYIMHAETTRWEEMGRGHYGPMRGMLFGRLKFEGPKWEAMKNMRPFGEFLLLIGKVPSDTSTCP